MINYCEKVNITDIPEENSCVTEKIGNIILGYQPAIQIEFLNGQEKGNVVVEAVIIDLPEVGFTRLLQEVTNRLKQEGSIDGTDLSHYGELKMTGKTFMSECEFASFKLLDKNNQMCGGFDAYKGKYSLTIEKQKMPLSVAWELFRFTCEVPNTLHKGMRSLFMY